MNKAGHSNPDLKSDIICYQILPRLPAKSLMRFKCVCKSWSSFIRGLCFFTAYQNFHSNKKKKRNTTNLLLVCRKFFFTSQIGDDDQQGNPAPVTFLSNITYDPFDCHRPYVQCINGLVFASPHDSDPALIFNPTTQESIKLTPDAALTKCYGPEYLFGCSPVTNEYKVVHVVHHDRDENILTLSILTLGTPSSSWRWRRLHVKVDPLYSPPWRNQSQVCLHGAIHWLSGSKRIDAFDVGDEKFRVIPLPKSRDIGSEDSPHYFCPKDLVDVGGCVAVFGQYYDPVESNIFGLWILKDYQNHVWVEEIILLPKRYSNDLCYNWTIRALCTIHTGELAIMVHPQGKQIPVPYYEKPPKLLLYDMKIKRCRELRFDFPEWIPTFDEPTENGLPTQKIPRKTLLPTVYFWPFARVDDTIFPLK